MSVLEIENISRSKYGRSIKFSENILNKYVGVAKFCVCSIQVF